MLQAGKLDEIQISVVPLLLGAGVRLLDHLDPDPIVLEQTRVIESEGVRHPSALPRRARLTRQRVRTGVVGAVG